MSAKKQRWIQLLFLLSFAVGGVQVNDMLNREKPPHREFERTPMDEFDWPEAGMAVELPGIPKKVERDVSKFGVVMSFSGRSAFDGVVSYMAAFVDYPLELPLPVTAEELVELVRWQLTETFSGEEIVVKPRTFGKHIAFEAWTSGEPGSRSASRFRLVLVGRRGYILTVTGMQHELDAPKTDRFFESFRPLDEP